MNDVPSAPWCVLGRASAPDGHHAVVPLAADGERLDTVTVAPEELAEHVARIEREDAPRWVFSDAAAWYPRLLSAGVRLRRCHDLRLVHRILRHALLVPGDDPLPGATAWDTPLEVIPDDAGKGATLFDLQVPAADAHGVPDGIDEMLAEFGRQRQAIEAAGDQGRLRMLAAAESAGALVAAEMHAAGIPWDVAEHDRILADALGPRPRPGQVPKRMAETAAEVRRELGDPRLDLDSPPKVLRALRRAEIDVASTSRWELADHDHPAIEPLLRYKSMSRLLTANGWAWIDEWVHDGRYRPVYVPGGVVTGRWASSGGGALQIPRRLRPAMRADPGWLLVGADVAQLEPRVLAAMADDRAMLTAGAGTDLYAGIVETGVVATRQEAKIAVLGGLYGGTTGDSGRLVPRLRNTFSDAMGLVDRAAEIGEGGGTVSTWLGRSSPAPDPAWTDAGRRANLPDAQAGEQERARRAARDRGRFTRNFVVQGTAAEWALAWIALLRQKLEGLDPVGPESSAEASGPIFADRAHLVFFLHDEIMVHTPAAHAEAVAGAIRDAADEAGRLLFPGSTVDFPLEVQIGERSAQK